MWDIATEKVGERIRVLEGEATDRFVKMKMNSFIALNPTNRYKIIG